jgi:hypothetical protein
MCDQGVGAGTDGGPQGRSLLLEQAGTFGDRIAVEGLPHDGGDAVDAVEGLDELQVRPGGRGIVETFVEGPARVRPAGDLGGGSATAGEQVIMTAVRIRDDVAAVPMQEVAGPAALPRIGEVEEDLIRRGVAPDSGLRWAQTQALALPKTGMAVAVDIGEGGNIHPGNKVDVGKRLALIALAKEYGQKVEFSGPTFESMRIDGNNVRIELSHADGLRTKDSQPPKAFTVQDADGTWHPGTATIAGFAIVVSNPDVPAPKAVRYAWASNPAVNLCNSANLPAVPFRTDGR